MGIIMVVTGTMKFKNSVCSSISGIMLLFRQVCSCVSSRELRTVKWSYCISNLFFCTFIYNTLLRIIQTSYIFWWLFLTENKQAYASVNLTFRKLLYLYYRENDLNNRYSTRNVDKYFSLSENSRIILLKGN